MAADANSRRITGRVQGKDITLVGPLSKDEIRNKVWWWQAPTAETPEERQHRRHEYDHDQRDVIATLGGYYTVPGDPRSPEADELVDMVHTELSPDRQ
ncbi:hypothetical protein [Streptomyces sp. NPDC048192]|jgi:hypothetical protein|uniref:hypothetical protein n=1 Tax=Streptomyces sp. NPDC048192 TaxID=3365510 RepID=UPI0037157D72